MKLGESLLSHRLAGDPLSNESFPVCRTSTKRQARNAKGKEKQLKEELDRLLSQPLVMRGISARYITSGGNSALVESMLKGDSHEKLLGMPKTRAVDDL